MTAKIDFDAVEMMREIRDKHHKVYEKNSIKGGKISCN